MEYIFFASLSQPLNIKYSQSGSVWCAAICLGGLLTIRMEEFRDEKSGCIIWECGAVQLPGVAKQNFTVIYCITPLVTSSLTMFSNSWRQYWFFDVCNNVCIVYSNYFVVTEWSIKIWTRGAPLFHSYNGLDVHIRPYTEKISRSLGAHSDFYGASI